MSLTVFFYWILGQQLFCLTFEYISVALRLWLQAINIFWKKKKQLVPMQIYTNFSIHLYLVYYISFNIKSLDKHIKLCITFFWQRAFSIIKKIARTSKVLLRYVAPYQWTKTFPPLTRASWIKSLHSGKNWARFCSGVSLASTHLYSIS